MSDLIINKTNLQINQCLDQLKWNKVHMSKNGKHTWLKETDFPKIRALVGLLYMNCIEKKLT